MARSADGRGAPTGLTECLLASLELDDVAYLPMRLHVGSGMERNEIAALAPLVVVAAAEGDAVAGKILEEGCNELALMAEAVARKIDATSEPLEIALVGGVASSGALVFGLVRDALAAVLPHASLIPAMLPPVMGACLLAAKLAGHPIDQAGVDRLRSSWDGQGIG